MTDTPTARKSLTLGEFALLVVFAATAIGALLVAGKAYTGAYAFHAILFALGSGAAIFLIIERYQNRPAELAAADHRRAAELQLRSDQVRHHRFAVLGRRRICRRPVDRARTRLSAAESRSALDQLRPAQAVAHFGGHLRLRRQRLARHVDVCRSAHLPGAHGRRSRPVVRRTRLQLLHSGCRHRLPARHHPVQGICRAGVVRRPVADHRLGRLSAGLSRHDPAAQGAAYLRRQLVLSGLYPDHRGASPRQQRRRAALDLLGRNPTSSGPVSRTP